MAQKKKVAAPTRSFDEMVADAQIKRLQPIVQQQVTWAMQQASQAIYKFIMSERAQMQVRQMAFERLLKANAPWFNEDVLALEVAAVEDEAQGLVPSTEPAKVGDKVRVTVEIKGKDGTYGDANKFAIHQVGVKSPTDTLQTNEDIETAIVGLNVGESREFTMNYDNGDGTKGSEEAKVTLVAVSCMPQEVAAQ